MLFLCAISFALSDFKSTFQQSPSLPQGNGFLKRRLSLGDNVCLLVFKLLFVLLIVPVEVECRDRSLFISVDIPSSGVEPRFEGVGAFEFYILLACTFVVINATWCTFFFLFFFFL